MKPELFQIAKDGMATRFEFALHGKSECYLRSAAEEALYEISRIEKSLSYYSPSSEIAQINREAGLDWVRINPETFNLISNCIDIASKTNGLFDIAVSPLIHLWNNASELNSMPTDDQISSHLEYSHSGIIELDSKNFSIRFQHPNAEINLGSIGKGYALQLAFEILQDLEVPHGLIQGGTSSIIAWGHTPEESGWKIAIQKPSTTKEYSSFQTKEVIDPNDEEQFLAIETLNQTSLSVSSIYGKGFTIEGQYLGHVIDPKSGMPANVAQLSSIKHTNCGFSDALSTALLVGGPETIATIEENFRTEGGYLYIDDDTPCVSFDQDEE